MEAFENTRRALGVAVAMRIAVYDARGLACAETEWMTLVTGDRRQAEIAAQLSPPVQVEPVASEQAEGA